MSDLTLRMFAQNPVPVPRPTAVEDDRVVSGVRTINIANLTSMYSRKTVSLHFNNNELFKLMYEDDYKNPHHLKYKYLPKEKRLVREEWDEKKKAYKPTDVTNGAKNELVSALKEALKVVEKGRHNEEKDPFVETTLKNMITEIDGMVLE